MQVTSKSFFTTPPSRIRWLQSEYKIEQNIGIEHKWRKNCKTWLCGQPNRHWPNMALCLPVSSLLSLPNLLFMVSVLLFHWFGMVLLGGLVGGVWFRLTMIFGIHHLFFKDYFCTIRGSCWFFVPLGVQGCITLGHCSWRTNMMHNSISMLYHSGSFKWENQRRLWSNELGQ